MVSVLSGSRHTASSVRIRLGGPPDACSAGPMNGLRDVVYAPGIQGLVLDLLCLLGSSRIPR
jgi:hypothetical protein